MKKSNCPLQGTNNCEEIKVCQIFDCPFWAERKIIELGKWHEKYKTRLKEKMKSELINDVFEKVERRVKRYFPDIYKLLDNYYKDKGTRK